MHKADCGYIPLGSVVLNEIVTKQALCSIYIDVRAKRNRSIRLFENRSIVFLIIERFEFLMLRFYNVCEDVYLMQLKSSRSCFPSVGHHLWTVQSVKET